MRCVTCSPVPLKSAPARSSRRPFGPPQVPDLSPLTSVAQLQRDLLVAVLRPLAAEAASMGVSLLLEPLNRYEARFPKDLAEGCSICEEVRSTGLRLMADFFHMSIEEADIAALLTVPPATYVRHIHLADSNRQLPGLGHTQFVEAFRALDEIGFEGFGALECAVPDPPPNSSPAAPPSSKTNSPAAFPALAGREGARTRPGLR